MHQKQKCFHAQRQTCTENIPLAAGVQGAPVPSRDEATDATSETSPDMSVCTSEHATSGVAVEAVSLSTSLLSMASGRATTTCNSDSSCDSFATRRRRQSAQ